jgi:Lon protease-like protein
MFPLGTVLFPGALLPLHVFEERYRALVADCLAGTGCFGVVLIERGSEVGGGDQRVGVGTEAHIEAARPFDDGRWAVIARGVRRIEVAEWAGEAPYPCAAVCEAPDTGDDVDADGLERAAGAVHRARALASELGRATSSGDLDGDDGASVAPPDDESGSAGAALWRLCEMAPLTAFDRQRLLEAPGRRARAALLTELAVALGDDLAGLR